MLADIKNNIKCELQVLINLLDKEDDDFSAAVKIFYIIQNRLKELIKFIESEEKDYLCNEKNDTHIPEKLIEAVKTYISRSDNNDILSIQKEFKLGYSDCLRILELLYI